MEFLKAEFQKFEWVIGGADEPIRQYSAEIAEKAKALPVIVLDPNLEAEAAGLPAVIPDCAGYLRMRAEKISRQVAFHEILHLWRYYAHDIPSLTVRRSGEHDDAVLGIAGMLENSIEHSVIGPIEYEHYPERRDFWDRELIREATRLSPNNADRGRGCS